MSELRDRLEALAARGTPRGADDVLRAAQRDAQTIPSDDSHLDVDDSDMTIIDDDLPVVTVDPRSRKRKRFGSFVASAGIAALVGVGALAVSAMIGSGGAGSPEGAVRQLADAVSNKDALAAVDVLVPSEVRSMRETVKNATERAAELRIVDEASKPLAGVDLSVDHLALRTEPLADGYAKVIITSGEISASTHRAQLSSLLQKALRKSEDGNSQADLAKLAGDSGLPTFVVVVRQHGGWFVSPAYTAMEYIREVNDYPAADFGSGKSADLGADSPEAAVSDALRAWQSANWDRLIALAPPDELPLYDYRAMIDASAADWQVDFTIDHLSTTATESGDSAIVKLDAGGTTGTDGATWQVGGSCASFLSTAASGDGPSGLCLSGDLSATVPFGLMMMGGTSGNQSTGPVSVSVVRENGRWFVSPVTTVLNVLDNTIRNIDQREVYTLLGLAYELPPDGTVTLDQPFDVPAQTGSWWSSRVYAFDGRAGQEVVGEVSGAAIPISSNFDSNYAYGTIYSADGAEVSSLEFQRVPTGAGNHSFYASSIKLPKTGSYRLVLRPYYYGPGRESLSLTLWDLADAPEKLRTAAAGNSYQGGGESCSSEGFKLGGSVSCKSASARAPLTQITPTSVGRASQSPSTTISSSGSSSGSSSSGVASTTTASPSTTIPAPNSNSAP